MKNSLYTLILSSSINFLFAQGPAITSWLQNNTAKGSYYMNGNSTSISNNILVNCQTVQYSSANVYISTKGIPSYPTGPFLDGNPSQASSQNAIFKFPLSPVQNTGTPTITGMGNIGVFINGVALFNPKDGVSWKNSSNSLAGGPLGGMGDGVWNRDAIVAEKVGFDCSKGHPAMGNYHHHQNPSAFKSDLVTISNICNPYDANGLYVIDSTQHSPLLGYAYDGFPIYGAYGYKNTDGSGGIVRMKSSYQLRNISVRNTSPSGSSVTSGPTVSSTYPLGYFMEDYEFVSHPSDPDFLDVHNGRFCKTPDYPNGTYAYFCTVDANWNSAYPYIIGTTYYGIFANRKVTSITEPTTIYNNTSTAISKSEFDNINVTIAPNPATDMIFVQLGAILKYDLTVRLVDVSGKIISEYNVLKGSTLAFFDTQTLYEGIYFIQVSGNEFQHTSKIMIQK